MTPKQREAIEAVEKYGSHRKAANALGIGKTTLQHRLKKAKKYQEADVGVQGAMAETGLQDISNLHSGWLKTEGASLYFQMPHDKVEPEDVAERIKAALEDVEAIEPVAGPDNSNAETMTVYPLPDAHIGLMSWGKETGEDYDTNIARERIRAGFSQCLVSTPPSSQAIIVAMGDLLHGNDHSNQTPASKHPLDVDGRHYRNMEVAIDIIAAAAEAALKKHERVTLVIQPGNHDKEAYIGVLFALYERYRNNPRIEVQKNPGEFFVMEWGKTLIASHHGDKGKAERLVLALADEHPEMWGRTRYRYYFTGHLHHTRMQDIGGVQVEQLRAITAKDAYAKAHAYTARAEMQAITYHKDRGEVSRVKVAL